jgi:uncharacterized delta-60 repeat protein
VKRLPVLFGLALVAFGFLGVSSALSLTGGLDPSFGTNGVVAHSALPYRSVDGIAVQPDGKIVVLAGDELFRYLPDGSPDASFGESGDVATPFPARALALQRDGKIVVAGGATGTDFAIARYTPDGAPDTSFGTDGTTKTDIPEAIPGGFFTASASALAVLPGGDILAAGTAGGGPAEWPYEEFVLVRYTPGGVPRMGFGDGGGGIVESSFTGDGAAPGNDWLSGIVVRPHEIVATGSGYGYAHGGDTERMIVARYAPDGSLQHEFLSRPGLEGGPPAVQRGKLVVAGSVLARFGASGHLDRTFGVNGFRRGWGSATAVLAQHDGKILLAVGNGVVRLLPNGTRDKRFGTGGVAQLFDSVSSLALQRDGKILVGGRSADSWTIARLLGS